MRTSKLSITVVLLLWAMLVQVPGYSQEGGRCSGYYYVRTSGSNGFIVWKHRGSHLHGDLRDAHRVVYGP